MSRILIMLLIFSAFIALGIAIDRAFFQSTTIVYVTKTITKEYTCVTIDNTRLYFTSMDRIIELGPKSVFVTSFIVTKPTILKIFVTPLGRAHRFDLLIHLENNNISTTLRPIPTITNTTYGYQVALSPGIVTIILENQYGSSSRFKFEIHLESVSIEEYEFEQRKTT